MKYEYMTIDEIIATMPETEWFELMTDCYIDAVFAEEQGAK